MTAGSPVAHRAAVYTAADLRASPNELNDIVAAINLAWTKHESAGFRGPRFVDNEALLSMLGSEGICAVLRPTSSTDLSGPVLASGSAIRWQPQPGNKVARALEDERPGEYQLVQRGLSYEVKAVVTAASPDTRGKGLASVCIEVLLEYLAALHPGETELVLWIQLAEAQNGPYWRRRGYEQVGPVETKPKGIWGSERDFQFATLLKRAVLPPTKIRGINSSS